METKALKAIRAKYLDCSNHQPSEVRLCPVVDCPLYPFRMGKNPFKKPTSGSFKKDQSVSPLAENNSSDQSCDPEVINVT